ncbi:MAG: hypothetical protein OXH70_00385 [Acidobacteria bacterium]|nr:hypothetical protein [Acidobacteriota bacterium]
MAKTERRQAVGFGLPQCLNELERLGQTLSLNRPSRSRILQSSYFRDRVEIAAGKKRAGWAELLAFYGNPAFRRELFNLHLIYRTVEQRPGPPPSDVLPRSLEYEILQPFLAPAGAGKPATPPSAPNSAIEVESRVERWSSLDDEARRETKLLLFAKATLLDDSTVLGIAARKAPELAAEFENLWSEESRQAVTGPVRLEVKFEDLPAVFDVVIGAYKESPASSREREDLGKELLKTSETAVESLFDALSAVTGTLTTSAELAVGSSITTRLDERVVGLRKTIQSRLEELEDQASENLRDLALAVLDEIDADSRSSLLHPEDLGNLRGLWLDSRGYTPRDADTERERLQQAAPTLLQTLREAYDGHQDIERELEGMRKDEPEGRQARREWEDRKDDLVLREVSARRTYRKACDAITRALEPTSPPDSGIYSEPPPPEAEQPEEPAEPAAEAPEPTVAAAGESANDKETATSGVEGPRGQADTGEGMPRAETSPVGEAENPAPAREATPLPAVERSRVEEPRAQPEWDEQEQRIREGVADALAADPPRLSYAYHLCRLAENLDVDAGQPRAELLEAALYASRLRRSDGSLAERLASAFERLQPDEAANRDVGRKNTSALIGFSAALPAAVIAPYSGAAAYLQDLTHEGLDALYRFARESAQCSWDLQKAQVDAATVVQAARGQAGRRDALRVFARDLRAWWKAGRQRKMSYIPANRVWNVMCQESNELGQLLQTMRSEGHADEVRRLSAQLGDESQLRRIVDRHASNLLTVHQKIDAKVFLQFQRHLEEPLALARRYLALDDVREPVSSHRQEVVDALVQSVQRGSTGVLDRLDRAAAVSEQDPLVAAASALAGRTVRRVRALLCSAEAGAESGEPDPDHLLHSSLLRYPESGIDRTTPGRRNEQAELEILLDSRPVELPVAFERYCEIGDLDLAWEVADWLETEANIDHEALDSLRNRIAEEHQTLSNSLRSDVAVVRQAVDLAFSQGRLSADQNDGLLRQLASIDKATDEDRPRFNVLHEELETVREELAEADRDERRRVLEEAAKKFSDKDDPRRAAVEQHVEDGDLLVAYELLNRTGESPPPLARAERQSPLDAYLEVDENELRSRTTNKQWPRLRQAAEAGERHGPLHFDRLDEDERLSATALLDAWKDLKRDAALQNESQNITDALARLLRALDFTDPEVEASPTVPGFVGTRFRAEPLGRRDRCPLPQFGSMAHGKYRLLVFLEPTTVDGIHQRMEQAGKQEATIAICLHALGERTRKRLARICLREKQSLLVLDEPFIGFLSAQGGSRLATLFACTLPYTYNQPFIRRASVVPPEMFFGRDKETEEIIDLHGSCFVYGGRQLGKTALLRHVERIYSKPDAGQYAVWIDLKAQGIGEIDAAEIWPAIWNALEQCGAIDPEAVPKPRPGKESVRRFMRALHKTFNRETGASLLLLFDEADGFLERDASNRTRESFAESAQLKSLMERSQSTIKVVFAGLHNVLRTTTQSNHPLAHLGQPIRIGPFIDDGNQRHAVDLLQCPLEACGCRFEPERLAQRVLAAANYYPSLIQIYGAELASRAMEASEGEVPRHITKELLDSIDEDSEHREEVRQRFEWTLQLDSRYEAIAYAIAFESLSNTDVLRRGMKNSRIQRHALLWYGQGFPKFGANVEFAALLQEMVELGVLRQGDEPDSHCLRNPNVLNLLGTSEDIERKLDDLGDRVPLPTLGPRDKRRLNGDEGPLHRPLTLLQEREVVGVPRRHGVVVICGLGASGIANSLAFLAQGPTTVRGLPDCKSLEDFEEHLTRGLRQRQRLSDDAVLFPVSGEWDVAWLNLALRLVGRQKTRPYARVVFIADTDRALSLNGVLEELALQESALAPGQPQIDVVRLGPWSLGFAAKWLEEEHEFGHKLTPDDDQRLARESGGWPVLLEHIRQGFRHGDRSDLGDLTKDEGISGLLAQDLESLRTAFGLDRPLLQQALRRVQEESVRETTPAEARMLRHDEQGDLFDGNRQISLAESRQPASEEREEGTKTAELLHLLQRDVEGGLRVDPVAARILDSIRD